MKHSNKKKIVLNEFCNFGWNFDLEHCLLMLHSMLTNTMGLIKEQNSYDLFRTVIYSFAKNKTHENSYWQGRGGGVRLTNV